MNIDFAIIGSTPKAALLACILAKTHAKSVILIAQFPHTLRIQRGFDISISPITRPQTWQVLKDNISSTIEFLNKTSAKNINIKTIEKIDPIFVATELRGQEALSHIRNMATGFGFSAEPQAISERFLSSYKFRDAARLLRRPFFASLNQRLKNCGVKLINPAEIKIKNKKDTIDIISKETNFSAKQMILVDDEALQNHLSEADISNIFIKTSMLGFLTEPIKKMQSPNIFNLDNGLIIHQRDNGALDCLAPTNKQTLQNQICLMLNDKQKTRLAGKTNFIKLSNPDGAAIFGKIARSRYISISNFGITGLFQTPAIARMLCKTANKFEQQYFSALAPNSTKHKRQNISQYCASLQNNNSKNRSDK